METGKRNDRQYNRVLIAEALDDIMLIYSYIFQEYFQRSEKRARLDLEHVAHISNDEALSIESLANQAESTWYSRVVLTNSDFP